jgi:hypothetical protein
MTKRTNTAEQEQDCVYTVPLTYDERITSEHLGSHKYSTVAQALGELITNAFDANARTVRISVERNEICGVQTVTVSDDGDGMTLSDIRSRFAKVAVPPQNVKSMHFGRFGVGRFAVYRIGSHSEWSTVARDGKAASKLSFVLRKDRPKALEIQRKSVTQKCPTGTTIVISNILQSEDDNLAHEKLRDDLLSQFCSYLLGNTNRTIRIQGQPLDVISEVLDKQKEVIPASKTIPDASTLSHLLLKKTIDRTRFPAQVLFAAKGRTIAHVQPETVPANNYLGVVECPFLDKIASANREAIIELDGSFSSLKGEVLRRVGIYEEDFRRRKRYSFIEHARKEEYYPYRTPPTTSIMEAKQAVYDVLLEKVNDKINLANMTKKQQAVMFNLLNRSLENESLLEVLQQIAAVSDEDIEKFHQVLEKTTLESIIRLSHEVTTRLDFLSFLHELVYGAKRKSIKERAQLHKIIEIHTWIFGPKFHLATSDESFRRIVQRHRQKAGLASLTSEQLEAIKGINDIPDLFLAAEREYQSGTKHQNLLVELKAPKVQLGRKEVEQVRRYADTILESNEFDKQSTHWDLFLVSSGIKNEIEKDRSQVGKAHGVLWEWREMTVWAFTWSEIITEARDEMHLVNNHLEKKSQELSVSDYVRENFPEILPIVPSETASEERPKVAKSG